jgi:hypothetical protein
MNRNTSQRQSAPPLSHAKLNMMQLKEQQAINRERKRQEEFEEQKKYQHAQSKRERFSHVPSHLNRDYQIRSQLEVPSLHGPQDDVEIKVYIRECEPDVQMFSQFESDGPRSPPKDVTPTRHRVSQMHTTRPQSENSVHNVQRNPAVPPKAVQAGAGNYGAVPRYLQERKAEMQAEKEYLKRQAEEAHERAKYPAGMRPVTSEERSVMLEQIQNRKRELEVDLGRIPIRFDTLASRERRKQIETELLEVEAAEKKFSGTKQILVPN